MEWGMGALQGSIPISSQVIFVREPMKREPMESGENHNHNSQAKTPAFHARRVNTGNQWEPMEGLPMTEEKTVTHDAQLQADLERLLDLYRPLVGMWERRLIEGLRSRATASEKQAQHVERLLMLAEVIAAAERAGWKMPPMHP